MLYLSYIVGVSRIVTSLEIVNVGWLYYLTMNFGIFGTDPNFVTVEEPETMHLVPRGGSLIIATPETVVPTALEQPCCDMEDYDFIPTPLKILGSNLVQEQIGCRTPTAPTKDFQDNDCSGPLTTSKGHANHPNVKEDQVVKRWHRAVHWAENVVAQSGGTDSVFGHNGTVSEQTFSDNHSDGEKTLLKGEGRASCPIYWTDVQSVAVETWIQCHVHWQTVTSSSIGSVSSNVEKKSNDRPIPAPRKSVSSISLSELPHSNAPDRQDVVWETDNTTKDEKESTSHTSISFDRSTRIKSKLAL